MKKKLKLLTLLACAGVGMLFLRLRQWWCGSFS